MNETKALEKVIEIVRRQHEPYITIEHQADILAIADEATSELTYIRSDLNVYIARDIANEVVYNSLIKTQEALIKSLNISNAEIAHLKMSRDTFEKELIETRKNK